MIRVIYIDVRRALRRIRAGTNISSIECQTSRQSVAKQNGIIAPYTRSELRHFDVLISCICATKCIFIGIDVTKKEQNQL